MDINRLKELAQNSTPGPWVVSGEDWGEGTEFLVRTGKDTIVMPINYADAEYIAACSPENVLALIAKVEAAEKGLYVISQLMNDSYGVPDVDWLSNVIRQVDGNNSLGAGALAEKIVEAMEK